jgi:hypothetical protein
MDVMDLLQNPVFVAGLAVVMRAALAWQRGLSWPEYRILHGLKLIVFPPLQRYSPAALPAPIRRVPVLGRVLTAMLTFNELVNRKGGRDGGEYVTTAPVGLKAVTGQLRDAGGSLHLINSLKRRPPGHGNLYSGVHLVWTHADGTQTEVFGFANDDGTSDWYAHHETSVSDPEGHLSDGQTDGDPRGVLANAGLGV